MSEHSMRRLGWWNELLIGHMVMDCTCGYRIEQRSFGEVGTQIFYDEVWEHIAPYVKLEA